MSTLDPDADEHELVAAQVAWLQSADRDDWHRVALDFNWGEPLYLLDWIVSQPDCDVATALTVFWAGEPLAWLDEEGDDRGEPDPFSWLNAKICTDIASRVAAGGYVRSEIAFEPNTFTKKDYLDLAEAVASLERPSFPAPRDLITTRRGRTVENDEAFYRRYPEHLSYSTLIQLPNQPIKSWRGMAGVRKADRHAKRQLPSWLKRA